MSENTYLSPSFVAPPFLLISAISTSNPMVVSVSTVNSYVVGQLAHLSVPESYGMIQADQQTGLITAINGMNFTLNIDSSQYDPFVAPTGNVPKPATLSPAGSRNIYNFTYVPFHSVDGDLGN